jgi:putative flippase GtrA
VVVSRVEETQPAVGAPEIPTESPRARPPAFGDHGPPPESLRRTERARDVTARAADWTWQLVLRIHLGTRKPGNWIELFKFGLVGGTGYVINLAVFAVLAEALGVHHMLSAVGAFCVAVTNNFLWNRHWTFRATDGHPGFQAARFFTVSVLALGVNLTMLYLLVDVVGAPEIPSQALSVALAMPFNFIGNKLWTFGAEGR